VQEATPAPHQHERRCSINIDASVHASSHPLHLRSQHTILTWFSALHTNIVQGTPQVRTRKPPVATQGCTQASVINQNTSFFLPGGIRFPAIFSCRRKPMAQSPAGMLKRLFAQHSILGGSSKRPTARTGLQRAGSGAKCLKVSVQNFFGLFLFLQGPRMSTGIDKLALAMTGAHFSHTRQASSLNIFCFLFFQRALKWACSRRGEGEGWVEERVREERGRARVPRFVLVHVVAVLVHTPGELTPRRPGIIQDTKDQPFAVFMAVLLPV